MQVLGWKLSLGFGHKRGIAGPGLITPNSLEFRREVLRRLYGMLSHRASLGYSHSSISNLGPEGFLKGSIGFMVSWFRVCRIGLSGFCVVKVHGFRVEVSQFRTLGLRLQGLLCT